MMGLIMVHEDKELLPMDLDVEYVEMDGRRL